MWIRLSATGTAGSEGGVVIADSKFCSNLANFRKLFRCNFAVDPTDMISALMSQTRLPLLLRTSSILTTSSHGCS